MNLLVFFTSTPFDRWSSSFSVANLKLLALLPLAIAGTSFRVAGSLSGQGSFNGQGSKGGQGSYSLFSELGGSGSESSCHGLNPTGTPSLSSGMKCHI